MKLGYFAFEKYLERESILFIVDTVIQLLTRALKVELNYFYVQ